MSNDQSQAFIAIISFIFDLSRDLIEAFIFLFLIKLQLKRLPKFILLCFAPHFDGIKFLHLSNYAGLGLRL
jgi:hypothetical protein